MPIDSGFWNKKWGVKTFAHFHNVMGESLINAIECKNFLKNAI